jgi:hypothetical protein
MVNTLLMHHAQQQHMQGQWAQSISTIQARHQQQLATDDELRRFLLARPFLYYAAEADQSDQQKINLLRNQTLLGMTTPSSMQNESHSSQSSNASNQAFQQRLSSPMYAAQYTATQQAMQQFSHSMARDQQRDHNNNDPMATTLRTIDRTKLFIGNLPASTRLCELLAIFRKYGRINEKLSVVKDQNYAFIHFYNESDAKVALDEVNDSLFKDRYIRVQFSTSQAHIKKSKSKLPSMSAFYLRLLNP